MPNLPSKKKRDKKSAVRDVAMTLLQSMGELHIGKKSSGKRKKVKNILPQKKRKEKKGSSGGSISSCAAKLLLCAADPWDSAAEGACLPTEPARDTMKVTAYARFSMTIGTGGVGWVMLTPSVANDYPSAWVTQAGYAGTTLVNQTDVANPVTVAGVTSVTLNSPFKGPQLWNTQGDLSSATEVTVGRVVTSAVSVQYTGTELNKGGEFYCYDDPKRVNLYGASAATLGGYKDCVVDTAATRKKCWVSTMPLTDAEMSLIVEERCLNNSLSSIYGLTALLYPLSAGKLNTPANVTSALGSCSTAVMVVGFPGNTFNVEVISHLEYYGVATQSMATPSVSDPMGLGKVISAVAKAPGIKQSRGGSWSSCVKRGMTMVAKELAPIALSVALAAL